jgi:antitoxin component YwqK of YwqJK toxin-antitoxin module
MGKTRLEDLKGVNELGEGRAKLKSTAQLYTGEAIHSYPNGEIYWRIEYKNGERHGTTQYFHQNGQLSFQAYYKNGLHQNKSTGYYENGQIESITTYRKNGSRIRHEYWNKNTGVKTYEATFNKKNQPDIKKSFYPKGRKKRINKYQNGVLLEEKEWYENKSLAKLNTYDEKGLPISKKSFYSNGQVHRIENYKDNILHGEYVEYFRNGTIDRIGHFNRGVREGEFKRFYFNNGALKSEGKYKKGRPIFEASYDQSGKKINAKFNWRD